MTQLIQLIYSSVGTQVFSNAALAELLSVARRNNDKSGITGMLLYAEGSFFQVLEGERASVDNLFARILQDSRHQQVTLIIRESTARRSFGDWTMGYAAITRQEADTILGVNDFFAEGESFAQLHQGRAKKLLDAFKHGSWRARLSDTATPMTHFSETPESADTALKSGITEPQRPAWSWYSFAYQPIINASTGKIFSYEALIRGLNHEPAEHVLNQVKPAQMHWFDEQSRIHAIEMAARLGLKTHLNLNFLPLSVESSPTAMASILAAAKRLNLRAEQIVLEILEREIISDFEHFNKVINEYRSSGLIFAIDDFGSGYAGLNMLAEFQPNLIKLDIHLVRGIEYKGPRQAIVRGILRTCFDLGIDIIAEGVETMDEYTWLYNEGIVLFQGNLFARPVFEQLTGVYSLPQ